MDVREAEEQPGGLAWHPDRPDILQLLGTACHSSIQPVYYGSNHTFLVTLESELAGSSYAIYKPARGEYPLYDFAAGTLYRREVGSWLVDAMLGWRIVPPTVVTTGRYGVGSLQLFIEAVESAEIEIEELRRLALLDVLINNADRKLEHCLPGSDSRLWGIDHGLTFHVQPKLRTAFWHFAGSPLTAEETDDVKRLSRTLQRGLDPCAAQLADLISRTEMKALRDRIDRVVQMGAFPDPRYKPVPYRW